jgi:nitroreductase
MTCALPGIGKPFHGPKMTQGGWIGLPIPPILFMMCASDQKAAMAMEKRADTQIPIHELIGRRWSPRAFSDRPVEPDKLRSVLEAARWAPSSRNEQPWAFLLATREDSKNYADLLGLLVDANRAWAQKAPVLVMTLAHLQLERDGTPNRLALHDLGLATSNLFTQATALGLSAHQMGAFDVEAARKLFHVPAGWEPVSVIVLGYPGDADTLSERNREREKAPRQRKPLDKFVFSGTWGHAAPIVSPKGNP